MVWTCTPYKFNKVPDKFTPGTAWQDPTYMLPGNWNYNHMKKNERRDRIGIDNVRALVDSDPPKLIYSEHINVCKLRSKEFQRQEIEKNNRFMANRIAMVYQTRGQVDHVNTNRTLFSRGKAHSDAESKRIVEGNIQLIQLIHDRGSKSQYDRKEFMNDFEKKRDKCKLMRKYDPQVWDPLFEKRYRQQVKRGRALDHNYVWKF